VLVHNPGVQMRSEDLYISPTAVRVRYQFFNTTGRDQTVLVAFPMPDITIVDPSDMVAVPVQDSKNFLGFSTTVDGQPVKARVEQKVLENGVDRTALLTSLGIPLAPQMPATSKALERLPKAEQARLLKLGLAASMDFGAGQREMQATWTLKTIYYWRQKFPAGRVVQVEHRYTPSVGAAIQGEEPLGFGASSQDRQMAHKYCIDPVLKAAVEGARRGGKPFTEERYIDYVLSTGANWESPIGRFRLVVDKGRPDALVSFCMDGVKKIGPTRFEVLKTNFKPDRDLSIMILDRAK